MCYCPRFFSCPRLLDFFLKWLHFAMDQVACVQVGLVFSWIACIGCIGVSQHCVSIFFGVRFVAPQRFDCCRVSRWSIELYKGMVQYHGDRVMTPRRCVALDETALPKKYHTKTNPLNPMERHGRAESLNSASQELKHHCSQPCLSNLSGSGGMVRGPGGRPPPPMCRTVSSARI